MPQKAVIYKICLPTRYLYEYETKFNNFFAKTGTLCWEAVPNGAKLRNIFLIFKTTQIRIQSLRIKCRTELAHRLVYIVKHFSPIIFLLFKIYRVGQFNKIRYKLQHTSWTHFKKEYLFQSFKKITRGMTKIRRKTDVK